MQGIDGRCGSPGWTLRGAVRAAQDLVDAEADGLTRVFTGLLQPWVLHDAPFLVGTPKMNKTNHKERRRLCVVLKDSIVIMFGSFMASSLLLLYVSSHLGELLLKL